MRTIPKRAFLLALVVAAVGFAVIDLRSPDQQAERAPAPVEKQAPSATAAVATPTAPAPVAGETLSAKIDRLTASGSPADAFAAHQLVSSCLMLERVFKQFDAFPAEAREDARKQWAAREPELRDCATVPQWQRSNRLNNLTVAAKAGVPGAGLAYFREGPAGDPGAVQSRPDDPIVVAWKQEAVAYLRRDAVRGDLSAMDTMAELYSAQGVLSGIAKPDPKEALTWEAALWGVRELQQGKASPGRDIRLAQLSRGMPEADVTAAKAKAAELVAQCCASSAVSPTGKEPK